MLTLEYFFFWKSDSSRTLWTSRPESKAIEVIRTASLYFNRPWITLSFLYLSNRQIHAIYHLKAKELNTFQWQHIHLNRTMDTIYGNEVFLSKMQTRCILRLWIPSGFKMGPSWPECLWQAWKIGIIPSHLLRPCCFSTLHSHPGWPVCPGQSAHTDKPGGLIWNWCI